MRGRVENEQREDVAVPQCKDAGEHGARPLEAAQKGPLVVPVPLVLTDLPQNVGHYRGGRTDKGKTQQKTKSVDDALVEQAAGGGHRGQGLLLRADVSEG